MWQAAALEEGAVHTEVTGRVRHLGPGHVDPELLSLWVWESAAAVSKRITVTLLRFGVEVCV